MELRSDTFKQVSRQGTVRCGLLLQLVEDCNDRISLFLRHFRSLECTKAMGGKQTEGRQLRVYFCMRDVVIAESLARLKSVPRTQLPR